MLVKFKKEYFASYFEKKFIVKFNLYLPCDEEGYLCDYLLDRKTQIMGQTLSTGWGQKCEGTDYRYNYDLIKDEDINSLEEEVNNAIEEIVNTLKGVKMENEKMKEMVKIDTIKEVEI